MLNIYDQKSGCLGGNPRFAKRAKRLNLGFVRPYVCGLSHFEDLKRFKKTFSMYSALVGAYTG